MKYIIAMYGTHVCISEGKTSTAYEASPNPDPHMRSLLEQHWESCYRWVGYWSPQLNKAAKFTLESARIRLYELTQHKTGVTRYTDHYPASFIRIETEHGIPLGTVRQELIDFSPT